MKNLTLTINVQMAFSDDHQWRIVLREALKTQMKTTCGTSNDAQAEVSHLLCWADTFADHVAVELDKVITEGSSLT